MRWVMGVVGACHLGPPPLTTGSAPSGMGLPCDVDDDCPGGLLCLTGEPTFGDSGVDPRICSYRCTADVQCPTLFGHCGQVFTCNVHGVCDDAPYADCK